MSSGVGSVSVAGVPSTCIPDLLSFSVYRPPFNILKISVSALLRLFLLLPLAVWVRLYLICLRMFSISGAFSASDKFSSAASKASAILPSTYFASMSRALERADKSSPFLGLRK